MHNIYILFSIRSYRNSIQPSNSTAYDVTTPSTIFSFYKMITWLIIKSPH